MPLLPEKRFLITNGITVNNPLPGGDTGTISTDNAGRIDLIVTDAGSPPFASFTASAVSGVVTNFVELGGATNGPVRYYRVRVQTP